MEGLGFCEVLGALHPGICGGPYTLGGCYPTAHAVLRNALLPDEYLHPNSM